MHWLLPAIIAARHRASPPATQPSVAGSASWNEMPTGNPATRSWTCPADAAVLLCLAAADNMTTRGTPSWNGVPMTFLASQPINAQEALAWVLAAPATGSRNLTYSGFAFGAGAAFNPILVAIADGTAVGAAATTNSVTGFTSPFSVSRTPAASSSLLVDVFAQNGSRVLSAAGLNTQIAAEANASASGGASWRQATGVVPHSFAWNTDSTGGVASVIVEIPAA